MLLDPCETRAVVFDMDGVLIDSHPAHRAAWEFFLQSLGVQVSEAELAYILEGRTRVEILRHFLGDLPDKELQEFGRKKDEIFRDLERGVQLTPGIVDLLKAIEIMGMHCAVATSASEIRTASTIERFGLGGYFDAIITASDVRLGKPHPEVYRLACERMGVAPEHALAFDDAPAGVLAARAAGLRCIGVGCNGASGHLLAAGAESIVEGFVRFPIELLLRRQTPAPFDAAAHAVPWQRSTKSA